MTRLGAGRALLPIAALAAIGVALPPGPEPASAACGGVEKARARERVNPGGRAPLAIGDSVMLLAVPRLARIGFKVNAQGCRQWGQGERVMRHYKRAGKLPHLVVVGLGADGSITARNVRHTLQILGPKRLLALIVPRELGGGTSHDADVVRHAARAHHRRVLLLDWVRDSKGRNGWFQPDGIHLTYAGASAYTRLIATSRRYASAGEFPGRGNRSAALSAQISSRDSSRSSSRRRRFIA